MLEGALEGRKWQEYIQSLTVLTYKIKAYDIYP